MEWLRWILLAVGMLTLVGIVVVYFRHRSEQAVVLGHGRDQEREDPIDAQLRGGHTLGAGPAQGTSAADDEREDPLIDGSVGKARVVRSASPVAEASDSESPESQPMEPVGTPVGPSLFRQRQGDDADVPAEDAQVDSAPTEVQSDLFAERSDAPLGMSTDEPMQDVMHEDAQTQEPSEPSENAGDEAVASEDEQPVVLSLLLAQRAGEAFGGMQVQQLIEEIGFEFGDFSIYHFNGEDGSPWFSLMNGLNPGTFDPNDVDTFATPVLALFMQLPVSSGHPELVFERMLEVARDMADQLDAELLDDHREPISADSIDRYREQLIFF